MDSDYISQLSDYYEIDPSIHREAHGEVHRAVHFDLPWEENSSNHEYHENHDEPSTNVKRPKRMDCYLDALSHLCKRVCPSVRP